MISRLADLAAAAHLFGLDYLGDVPWAEFPAVKGWYQRLKSRPSFRPLARRQPCAASRRPPPMRISISEIC